MATTADFKNGMCIEYNNYIYTIVQFQHVKPGKGPAFVRTKLKNIKTGKVIDNTFSSGVKVTEARVERRPYQYLYKDDTGYNIMHTETYEQLIIDKDLFNAASNLLKEGQEIEVIVHADTEEVLYAELPQYVVLEVSYSEPGIRGDTSSSSSLKPATVETGTTVNVPLFINAGELIKVDTQSGNYVERVKKD